MTLPDICSPYFLDSLELSSTAWHFRTGRCGETAIDRYTYGVYDSHVPLLQVDAQVILPAKNRCILG